MNFDAFTAGVEPGGLRNTKEIGILICYMLDYINQPFQHDDLVDIIQENGLANYFEVTSALSELIRLGNVAYTDEENQMIEITKNGKIVSRQLSSELSVSVRNRAVSAVLKLMEQRRIERENPVIIEKVESGGYNVTVRITDGMRDLMSLTLFMPSREEATMVKKRFHQSPEKIYSVVLASVVGERDMLKEALRELPL